jgi:hypothetical protein
VRACARDDEKFSAPPGPGSPESQPFPSFEGEGCCLARGAGVAEPVGVDPRVVALVVTSNA